MSKLEASGVGSSRPSPPSGPRLHSAPLHLAAKAIRKGDEAISKLEASGIVTVGEGALQKLRSARSPVNSRARHMYASISMVMLKFAGGPPHGQMCTRLVEL